MNDITRTSKELVDSLMEDVLSFASAWSLVGSRFDNGSMLEDAEQQKAELRTRLEQEIAGPQMGGPPDRVVVVEHTHEPPAKQGPCPNCGATWVSAELSSSQEPDQPMPINHGLWRYLHDEHGLTLLQSELNEVLRLANQGADNPHEEHWDAGYQSGLSDAGAIRPALPPGPSPLALYAYAMTERHLSGYRLILGFDTLTKVQDAHKEVADLAVLARDALTKAGE